VRPGGPDWPSTTEWNRLKEVVGGRLINVESPLAACTGNPDTPVCQELLRNLRNPFFIGDQPWATQTTGWADAWMSAPSVFSIAAKTAADVAAAVDFARKHNLRLVVKGGGHSRYRRLPASRSAAKPARSRCRDSFRIRRRSAGSSRALRRSRSAAEEPMVCGLFAGAEWIRTENPAYGFPRAD